MRKKKVRIENVEMRVIKWEKIWNDYRKKINRERERERATHDTYYDYEPIMIFFFNELFVELFDHFLLFDLVLFFFELFLLLLELIFIVSTDLLFYFIFFQGVKNHIWGPRFFFK